MKPFSTGSVISQICHVIPSRNSVSPSKIWLTLDLVRILGVLALLPLNKKVPDYYERLDLLYDTSDQLVQSLKQKP